MTGQGTGDVGALITDILAAAQTSGASIGGNGTVFGVLPHGITFQVNPNDKDALERLEVFAKTIGARIELARGDNMPMGDITVQIGSRIEGLP